MAYDQKFVDYLTKLGLIKNPTLQTLADEKSLSLDSFVPSVQASTVATPTPSTIDLASIPKENQVVPEIPKVDSTVPEIPKRPASDWTDALSQGLAAYGDALMARSGKQGGALKNVVESSRLSEQQSIEDQQREIARKQQEKAAQLKEVQNASARNLLSKFTGKPPEEFAGMDAETIAKMEPLIGKIIAKNAKPEGVYNRNTKTGKIYLDGKEISGADVPAGAAVKDLADTSLQVSTKEEQQQDKLEKDYRDMLNKVISVRSGGLGLEDSKVNQAIHLQQMLNKAYDPKTKEYHIPPSMHEELAMGMARLISPTGVTAANVIEELRQKTAREGIAGALIYMGFDPKKIGGTTQSVTKFFADQIRRQGLTSQKIRDTYLKQMQGKAPSSLKKERRDYIDAQEIGNKLEDHMPGGKYFDLGVNQEATLPPEKQKRLEFLRKKKAEGTLQGGQ